MRTFKTGLAACLVFCCATTLQLNAQPWYGQITIPHDSAILSSAKRTFLTPGYVMAGFRPIKQNPSPSPNFVIDKLDAAGTFAGAGSFSNNYFINADPFICSAPAPLFDCNGVSIIETGNQGNGERYAIAVGYSQGIFFATLGAGGNILSQIFWNFPGASQNNRKPSIRESVAFPGQYYICGNFGGTAYVMKVNAFGGQFWGFTYGGQMPYMEPRDLIESPFNQNELIVVGRADVTPAATAADAFFMKLNAFNGTILMFNHYNWSLDSDDWFSSIEVANSPAGGAGFVMGGRAFGRIGPFPAPTNARYIQMITKLDQFGNVAWSTLIKPIASVFNNISGEEVNRVHERLNPNTGTYEYYGVAGANYRPIAGGMLANKNLVVFKLDNFGQKTIVPNEFHYFWLGGHAPASPSAMSPYTFSDLTITETGGGADDGFQAYGTTTNSADHYFVKSYFNGVSGCFERRMRIDSIFNGVILVGNAQIPFSPIFPCLGNIMMLPNPNLVNSGCYAPMVPGGSNLRESAATGIVEAGNSDRSVHVYPNPVNKAATITLPGKAEVVIYNSLGQLVYSRTTTDTDGNELTVNFQDLGLKAGLYSVQVSTGYETSSYKIIYKPE